MGLCLQQRLGNGPPKTKSLFFLDKTYWRLVSVQRSLRMATQMGMAIHKLSENIFAPMFHFFFESQHFCAPTSYNLGPSLDKEYVSVIRWPSKTRLGLTHKTYVLNEHVCMRIAFACSTHKKPCETIDYFPFSKWSPFMYVTIF